MKKYVKLRVYANYFGMTYRTAWKNFKAGNIPGFQDENTGTIYVLNPENINTTNKSHEIKAILYARVSSSTNAKSLDGQIERMRQYAAAKGYVVEKEVKEIASGLNDNRKKLKQILDNKAFDVLIVEHKDRLTRFGANYIEQALNNNNQKLEIINKVEEKDTELMDDFISIVTSFCGRIYGRKRAKKTKEIIEKINKC